MSSTHTVAHVPQWDVGDRMRKSLREAHIHVTDMAEYLDVGRNTVSNWINGHTTPPGAALRLWAQRCDVPLEWLRHGVDPTEPGATGPETIDEITRQSHGDSLPFSDFAVAA